MICASRVLLSPVPIHTTSQNVAQPRYPHQTRRLQRHRHRVQQHQGAVRRRDAQNGRGDEQVPFGADEQGVEQLLQEHHKVPLVCERSVRRVRLEKRLHNEVCLCCTACRCATPPDWCCAHNEKRRVCIGVGIERGRRRTCTNIAATRSDLRGPKSLTRPFRGYGGYRFFPERQVGLPPPWRGRPCCTSV